MKKIYLTIIGILLMVCSSYSQWITQDLGYTNEPTLLFDVEVVNENVVWTVPADRFSSGKHINEVVKTTDGGASWHHFSVGGDTLSDCINVSALDSNTAWVSKYSADTAYRGVFKTTDGGSTWVHQGAGSLFTGTASYPAFVYFKDANNGITVGDPESGYFEIWTTTNGGDSWTRVPSANIPAPAGDYSITNSFSHVGDTLWFGSYLAKMYRSVDFGQHWTMATVSNAANTQASDVYFINGTHGLARTLKASTATFGLYRTTNGGLSWSLVNYSGTWMFNELDGIPNTSTYISTGAGCSYSTDGGSTWITSYTTASLQGATGWANGTTGWVGSEGPDSLTGGIEKYSSTISLGVNETIGKDTQMRVFPNPSSGDFTVQIIGAGQHDALITVTDITGNVVFKNAVSNSNTVIVETLHLGNLSKGLYFGNVSHGATMFVQKFVLQ